MNTNKKIQISLEEISGGMVRATGRHDGATVCVYDGTLTEARDLTWKAIKHAASAHIRPNGQLDETYVGFNPAARLAMVLARATA